MENKFYVCRIWKRSGRVEFKMHKCLDNYCDKAYLDRYPDRVWQFSKSGAKKIVDRCNAAEWNKNCEYFMQPVTA